MPPANNDALNLELKILEAYSRDVGRGIARIDYDSMDLLNASTGDVIEIRGGQKSKVPILGTFPEHEHLQVQTMKWKK
jgi:transitional endoplasmic reticulum ATPase